MSIYFTDHLINIYGSVDNYGIHICKPTENNIYYRDIMTTKKVIPHASI